MIDTSTLTTFTSNNSGFNIGQKYYRNYSVDRTTIPAKNNAITQIDKIQFIPHIEGILGANSKFQLKTIYPGFLSGSGYLHEVKQNEEAFKLGFFFDHVTGMPVIPGSGVKGTIRSAFPGFCDDDIKANFNEDGYNAMRLDNRKKRELREALPYKKSKAAFLFCLIQNQQVEELTPEQFKDIYQLEQEIFESKNQENMPINLYERDIFHDAVPVGLFNNYRGIEKRLFGSDYITPHKHKTSPELDPFANPEPIKFLKVMPNVIYEFRFKLNPRILSVDQKEKLFQNILETIGIGAKTNVGYGQFSNNIVPNHIEPDNITEPENITGRISKNTTYQAKVVSDSKAYIILNNEKMTISTNKHNFETGILVKVNVTDFNNNTKKIQMLRIIGPV